MQVTVEVRVEPKPRAERTGDFGRRLTIGFGRRFAASDNPSIAILLDAGVNQSIAGETTPSLEVGTERAIGTDDRQEIAYVSGAQRGYQFYKQAGCECFTARVELDVGA